MKLTTLSIQPNVFKRIFPYVYIHCMSSQSFVRIAVPIFTKNKRNPTQKSQIEVLFRLPFRPKRGWEFGFPYFPLAADFFFKKAFKNK